MLDRYGLSDPTAGRAAGEFATAATQDLYDSLLAQATTERAAYDVGITIEKMDIADLKDAMSGLKAKDVKFVYTRGCCRAARSTYGRSAARTDQRRWGSVQPPPLGRGIAVRVGVPEQWRLAVGWRMAGRSWSCCAVGCRELRSGFGVVVVPGVGGVVGAQRAGPGQSIRRGGFGRSSQVGFDQVVASAFRGQVGRCGLAGRPGDQVVGVGVRGGVVQPGKRQCRSRARTAF